MAVERALISLPSFSLSSFSSSSPSSTGNKFVFLNPKFSSHFSLNTKPNQLGFARRRFKCTADYNRDYFNNSNYNQSSSSTVVYSRPAEIQWKKELCNTVHLIGVVGVAVEIKHLPSGKFLAWTRLAVKKSATDTTWINLTFWDDLASTAHQHVEKGQQIYVVGRLVSDTVNSDDGKQQTYYKVVVQQLNFIEKSFSSSETSFDRGGTDSVGQERKVVIRNSAGISDVTAEQLWQAFFANPLEWWDNRKTKRNPKAPDFKHKDTGEALWIEGKYNPPWVKSQLSILDTRMGYHNNQDSTREANLMAGDCFLH